MNYDDYLLDSCLFEEVSWTEIGDVMAIGGQIDQDLWEKAIVISRYKNEKAVVLMILRVIGISVCVPVVASTLMALAQVVA